MRIGTANVRNFPDMTQLQVAQDTATIMEHVTVAGLQEIQPHEDTPVVLEQLGDSFGMAGRAYETPIVFRHSKLKLLDHNTLPFHRPKLPRPESVHGAVTSAVFLQLERRHRFAVVNVHLVANGYNGDRLDVIADRWRVEWGMYRDECIRLWRMGLTVYAVGDLNNPRPPKLRPHYSFRWLSPEGSADHIGELANLQSVYLGRFNHERVNLNSDHDLQVVTGPLRVADDS